MEEGTPLHELLDEQGPEIEAVETQPVETAPETADTSEDGPDGPARGPDGKFISKQSTGVEDTAPPADRLPKEDYKAIREEREKRQRLESELEALRNQVQSLQQPPEPPPSLWEDEQGWQQHFGTQVAQQAAFNAKLDMSEMLARQNNDDFDDMKAKFVEMANANPAIVQQCLSDPHPWAKAYTIAKNAARVEELGAVDLADLEAKMRDKIMAELQQGSAPVPQQQPVLPPTLTTERNVGTRTGPAWGGPRSLEDLLR